MEDPKVEEGIARVKELIGIWQQYYTLLLDAFDRSKKLPPDADERFQNVKRVVAQRHDDFSKIIMKDFYVAQNVLQMVKRTISIHDFEKSSDVAIDKTLLEWHDANILFFETLGSLEYKKHKLSKISEAELKKAEAQKKRQEQIDKIRSNPVLYSTIKFTIIAAAILGFWFSPLRGFVADIPFVHSRINDFRQLFGYPTLEQASEQQGTPAAEGENQE